MTDFAEVKISQFSPVPGKPVRQGNYLKKKSLHPRRSSPIVLPRHGGVAQLGERLTGSQEVRGSIPLVSTIVNARPLNRVAFLFVKFCRQQQLSQILRQLLPKKLRNYLPGFVHSLLAKHNSLSNSRRQQYNSGSAHQPIHPHKPAAMRARQRDIPHNHGK